METPTIVVEQDFDGYFERLVRGWVKRKAGPFKHTEIHITSGPYRPDAVSTFSSGDTLTIDFYSALRTGFGYLSGDDIDQLVAML